VSDKCFIGKDGRLVSGCNPAMVVAALIEQTGETKKTLQVTLPNDMRLEDGVRITFDHGQPTQRPFERCHANGCTAAYVGGAELVDQLKHGKMLVVEATGANNLPIRRKLPLTGFADAYDSPPLDPLVFKVAPGNLQKALRAQDQGAEADRLRGASKTDKN